MISKRRVSWIVPLRRWEGGSKSSKIVYTHKTAFFWGGEPIHLITSKGVGPGKKKLHSTVVD